MVARLDIRQQAHGARMRGGVRVVAEMVAGRIDHDYVMRRGIAQGFHLIAEELQFIQLGHEMQHLHGLRAVLRIQLAIDIILGGKDRRAIAAIDDLRASLHGIRDAAGRLEVNLGMVFVCLDAPPRNRYQGGVISDAMHTAAVPGGGQHTGYIGAMRPHFVEGLCIRRTGLNPWPCPAGELGVIKDVSAVDHAYPDALAAIAQCVRIGGMYFLQRPGCAVFVGTKLIGREKSVWHFHGTCQRRQKYAAEQGIAPGTQPPCRFFLATPAFGALPSVARLTAYYLAAHTARLNKRAACVHASIRTFRMFIPSERTPSYAYRAQRTGPVSTRGIFFKRAGAREHFRGAFSFH
ncbi:hypothetical protein BOSP111201_26990 [Bordetella sputigena]